MAIQSDHVGGAQKPALPLSPLNDHSLAKHRGLDCEEHERGHPPHRTTVVKERRDFEDSVVHRGSRECSDFAQLAEMPAVFQRTGPHG